MYTENEIAEIVVDICFHIHYKLGPGLFESVYEEILCYELEKAKISFTKQQTISVVYEELVLTTGFRADCIIDNKVIIELKSIETIAPIHYKQIQTYLKLTNIKLGLLINFNVLRIKDGIHRIANKL